MPGTTPAWAWATSPLCRCRGSSPPTLGSFSGFLGRFLVIGAHLPIVKAWGFKPSTVGFFWEKGNFGAGYTTRSSCEFVVVGRRGRPHRASNSVRQFIDEPAREHSRKPDEVHARIEALCAGPRLELFARETRPD